MRCRTAVCVGLSLVLVYTSTPLSTGTIIWFVCFSFFLSFLYTYDPGIYEFEQAQWCFLHACIVCVHVLKVYMDRTCSCTVRVPVMCGYVHCMCAYTMSTCTVRVMRSYTEITVSHA